MLQVAIISYGGERERCIQLKPSRLVFLQMIASLGPRYRSCHQEPDQQHAQENPTHSHPNLELLCTPTLMLMSHWHLSLQQWAHWPRLGDAARRIMNPELGIISIFSRRSIPEDPFFRKGSSIAQCRPGRFQEPGWDTEIL